jgi:nitrate/TMAO reductase-like tetraheme cytochrome c subunit
MRRLKPILWLVVGLVIAFPLFSATYATMVRTSTPHFCASCHEIRFAYNTRKTSTHANNAQGVVPDWMDCHLIEANRKAYIFPDYPNAAGSTPKPPEVFGVSQ